jgi:uncharacterized protein
MLPICNSPEWDNIADNRRPAARRLIPGPCLDSIPQTVADLAGTVTNKESKAYAAQKRSVPLKMRLKCWREQSRGGSSPALRPHQEWDAKGGYYASVQIAEMGVSELRASTSIRTAALSLWKLIHPNSELRFISPSIGYGLFATQLIPKGTITWAIDPLDQIISPGELDALPESVSIQAHKYSYLNGAGDRILCWDHARFVNHSCTASCLSPGFDFEIAVRDIGPDEEITDDYGTLNLEVPFPCLCGAAHCRGQVMPDDPLRHAPQWDRLIAEAFPAIDRVEQPLWELVREKNAVKQVLSGELRLPSVLTHYRGHSGHRASA